MAKTVLIIGDTLVNKTFKASAAKDRDQKYPHSFLNEEILYLEQEPIYTIQGVGCIAKYLGQAGMNVHVWTSIGSGRDSQYLKEKLESYCGDSSLYQIDDKPTAYVVRVLRDITGSKSNDSEPDYRPQLRLDRIDSSVSKLNIPYDDIPKILGPGDICLVRVLQPDFLGSLDNIDYFLTRIQENVKKCGAKLILDLRPIPPNLRLTVQDSIICTTLSRLTDRRNVYKVGNVTPELNVSDAIQDFFWKMYPLSGLICFTNKEKIYVIQREDNSSWEAQLSEVRMHWPKKSKDACGSVVAGDAWIAGIVASIAEHPSSLTKAADSGNIAYCEAYTSNIEIEPLPKIHKFNTSKVIPQRIENNDLNRLEKVLKTIQTQPKSIQELQYPGEGKLEEKIKEFSDIIDKWKPRKGSDLIAVFGESRAGKEVVIKNILKDKGYPILGPINVYQFLGELTGCLSELVKDKDSSKKPKVLIIDEISPKDSARSLLNLMAEKKYHTYLTNMVEIDFSDHPIILLSSINPDDMLEDLKGRLWNRKGVIIPPLRERWEEIPLHLFRYLDQISPKPKKVTVSYGFLTGLLYHDYCPIHASDGAIEDSGLDQRNFRAFSELMNWVIIKKGIQESLELTKADLPPPLLKKVPHSASDVDFVRINLKDKKMALAKSSNKA